MKKSWYDAKFPARFDPGKNMMAWPPEFQEAVKSAAIRLQDAHPILRYGRIVTCETWVTNDCPLIEFPFHVHVSLCWEYPQIQ